MNDFNSIFPNFINQCVQLKQILTPIAFVLLVGGMISSIVTGDKSGNGYMRVVARTLILVMVLTFLIAWGNTLTTAVDSLVKNVLNVDPTKIFSQYRAALDMQKSNDSTPSWWEKVFSVRATIFESLVSVFLWCLSWVASAIVFFAYIFQKIILYMGYALSPIFIGFFAFHSLYDTARRYFLNLAGVMLWPLGWGVAGLITQGLIDFMTDRSFLHTPGIIWLGIIPSNGSDTYNFQNFIGAALLGIWLIFSTIAAPVIIAKSIAVGSLAGSQLMSGAAKAGRAGVATGATVGASIASGGGLAVPLGIAAGVGAGLESLAATSAEVGGGSLISSLASIRPRSGGNVGSGQRKSNGGNGNNGGGGQPKPSSPVANPPFASDDLTGAKAVADIMKRVKK